MDAGDGKTDVTLGVRCRAIVFYWGRRILVAGLLIYGGYLIAKYPTARIAWDRGGLYLAFGLAYLWGLRIGRGEVSVAGDEILEYRPFGLCRHSVSRLEAVEKREKWRYRPAQIKSWRLEQQAPVRERPKCTVALPGGRRLDMVGKWWLSEPLRARAYQQEPDDRPVNPLAGRAQ